MTTRESLHERTRGAGCPPALATDVSRNDVVDPVVEWPPGPPTRSADGDGRVAGPDDGAGAVALSTDDHADGNVARLAVSRGRQLLDASLDHLRTALETSPDAATAASVEVAIRDLAVVCERLDDVDA